MTQEALLWIAGGVAGTALSLLTAIVTLLWRQGGLLIKVDTRLENVEHDANQAWLKIDRMDRHTQSLDSRVTKLEWVQEGLADRHPH